MSNYAYTQVVSMASLTPDNKIVKKFKRLYSKYAKSGTLSSGLSAEPGLTVLGGHSGFAGSGSQEYMYMGEKFHVDRYANGKTFYGTDHHIRHEQK